MTKGRKKGGKRVITTEGGGGSVWEVWFSFPCLFSETVFRKVRLLTNAVQDRTLPYAVIAVTVTRAVTIY